MANGQRSDASVQLLGAPSPSHATCATRAETTGAEGAQFRVKLGVGVGLVPAFGAPAWRLVVAVEGFGHVLPH